MPTELQCEHNFPLSSDGVNTLWEHVRAARDHNDEPVAVRCVSVDESRHLNKTYRRKDKPTNVLTFSYDPLAEPGAEGAQEHDIALCLEVATQEAEEREASLRDYCAWLVVHAMLHATGLDHEESESKAKEMSSLEASVLRASGYAILE